MAPQWSTVRATNAAHAITRRYVGLSLRFPAVASNDEAWRAGNGSVGRAMARPHVGARKPVCAGTLSNGPFIGIDDADTDATSWVNYFQFVSNVICA